MVYFFKKSKVFYALFMITLFLLFAYHSVVEKSIFDVSITKYSDSKNLFIRKNSSDFKSSNASISNRNFLLSTASTDPSCGYFVRSEWYGRLGNQMFIYASFYGMVKKRKGVVKKTAFMQAWSYPPYLDQIFENLSIPRRALPRSSKNFTKQGEIKCCAYDNTGLNRLSCDGKNVLVEGYRQSYRYFDHVFDDIKKEFTFKKSIREKSRRLVDESLAEKRLSRNNCVVVGVHLRRGDFAREESRGIRASARVDYLKKAIRYHEQFHPRDNTKNIDCLVFLTFGGNYDWNSNASEQVELMRSNNSHLILIDSKNTSAEIDMCALILCDHAIISVGTFSWWVGFFSRGVVTYQKEYAPPNSRLHSELEPKDYFLPHWLPL